jgi:hypothetical protein
MNLSETLQSLAQDGAAAANGVSMRCVMANFRWESAVSDERAEDYSSDVGAVTTHQDWRAQHKSYLDSAIHIAKDLPRSAESFMACNRLAQLNEHLDDTFLVRLEALDGLFNQPLVAHAANSFWQRFFLSQKDLRKPKLSDGDEALRTEFTKQWNAHRTQARPLFATFLNDFGGNLEALTKQDWPHLLRDRLGLTHYPREANKSLPVALLCYRVQEVRDARLLAGKKAQRPASVVPPCWMPSFPRLHPRPLAFRWRELWLHADLANAGIPDASALTPELLTFPSNTSRSTSRRLASSPAPTPFRLMTPISRPVIAMCRACAHCLTAKPTARCCHELAAMGRNAAANTSSGRHRLVTRRGGRNAV